MGFIRASNTVAVRIFAAFGLIAASLITVPSGSTQALADDKPSFNLALNVSLLNSLAEPLLDPLSDPPGQFKVVKPSEFDPAKTSLVQGAWLNGIGCPTNAFYAPYDPITNSAGAPIAFSDAACLTGDPNDQRNMGLLLVKTGPTNNFASAVAELTNVKGMTVTEVGYDIRKQLTATSPYGSHCGAGAPRFDIVTQDNVVHFIGCNSPPGTPAGASTGWVRLRWDTAAAFPPVGATDTVKRIVIVFDEGTDASGAPDTFGAAILDNIDVNGTLVGHGAVDAD
jgi:hypothetical protein